MKVLALPRELQILERFPVASSLLRSPRETPFQSVARRWLFHYKMRWCIPVKNNLFPGFVPSTDEAETDLSRFLVRLHLNVGHFILNHFSFYHFPFLAPGTESGRGQPDRELVHSRARSAEHLSALWLCRAGLCVMLLEQNRAGMIMLGWKLTRMYSKYSSDWDAYGVASLGM